VFTRFFRRAPGAAQESINFLGLVFHRHLRTDSNKAMTDIRLFHAIMAFFAVSNFVISSIRTVLLFAG